MLKDNILLSHIEFFIYGKSSDVYSASHCLFDGLRTLDDQKVDLILAAGFDGDGMEEAYMNRLRKAAGKKGEGVSSESFSRKREKLYDHDTVATLSVLFVCRNNRALSAAAESIFRKLLVEEEPYCLSEDRKVGAEVYSESAGLYATDGENADHKTTKAGASVYDRNDIIIAMRDEQAVEILKAFPDLEGRVFSMASYLASKGLVMKDDKGRVISLSIPDPEGENESTYSHTAKALEAWIRIMFPYVLKDLGIMRT